MRENLQDISLMALREATETTRRETVGIWNEFMQRRCGKVVDRVLGRGVLGPMNIACPAFLTCCPLSINWSIEVEPGIANIFAFHNHQRRADLSPQMHSTTETHS